VVAAGLEPAHRVVESKPRMPTRLPIELTDRRQHACCAEVRDGLARDPDREVGDELLNPRACSEDDHLVVEVVHGCDPPPSPDAGAARPCDVEERMPRDVGEDDAALGLVQRCPAVGQSRAQSAGAVGVEQLVLDAARVESVRRGELRRRDDLDEPVQLKQPSPTVGLESAPARVRLLREPDPVRIRIRQPDDPRASVARATFVVEGDRVIQLAAQTLQSFFTGGGLARDHAEYPIADVVFRAPVLHPPSVRIFDEEGDFVFANPVRLWAGMNPDFFKGTVVEGEAAALMRE